MYTAKICITQHRQLGSRRLTWGRPPN